MTLFRVSPLAVLALAALACRHRSIHTPGDGTTSMAATDTASRSAMAFTQAFYDWYAHHDDRLETAVSDRPEVFGPELLAALTADIRAQAKSPGEIVGLDWDPLTASQDPCDPYMATGAVRRADTIAVAVNGSCKSAGTDTMPATVAQVWRSPTGWEFVNFEYPADTSNLLDDLARLRSDREAGSTDGAK